MFQQLKILWFSINRIFTPGLDHILATDVSLENSEPTSINFCLKTVMGTFYSVNVPIDLEIHF